MSKTPTVTRDMIIGDIVAMFPDAAEILLSYGIHCVGCYANAFETLEQGLLGHGYTEDQLQELINELNEYAQEYFSGETASPLPKEAEELEMTLTDAAQQQILKVAEAEEKKGMPLRIELIKSAEGFTYRMNFVTEEEVRQIDKTFTFAEGQVTIILDKRDHRSLNGLEIDFVKEEDRAGFKMNNPNDPKHQLG